MSNDPPAAEADALARLRHEPVAWMATYTFYGHALHTLHETAELAQAALDRKRDEMYAKHHVLPLFSEAALARVTAERDNMMAANKELDMSSTVALEDLQRRLAEMTAQLVTLML